MLFRSIGWIEVERGDLDAAEARCNAVLASPGEAVNTISAAGLIGLIHLERGDVKQGLTLLETAVGRLPIASRRDIFAVPLGEAYATGGDIVRARQVAALVDQAAQRSSSSLRHGRAQRLAAVIAEAEGRAAEADQMLAVALQTLARVPAPLDIARTHLAAARAAVARGNLPQARMHCDHAAATYAACHLPKQVERVAAFRGVARR